MPSWLPPPVPTPALTPPLTSWRRPWRAPPPQDHCRRLPPPAAHRPPHLMAAPVAVPSIQDSVELFTLTDGGQRAEAVAERLVRFIAEAKSTLELALYDIRLPGAVGDSVVAALTEAAERGVAVRL